ncbi:MAG: hypothetical protein H6R14_277 [Proteobacteria bacterium]|nr:hypothetical protein [Pseudomonadota bacterium]
MTQTLTKSIKPSQDPLGDYIVGVSQLPGKLHQIADNQRQIAGSLGRAVIALRSMAALNKGRSYPETKNLTPITGNVSASC